jgi:hypothetical protein
VISAPPTRRFRVNDRKGPAMPETKNDEVDLFDFGSDPLFDQKPANAPTRQKRAKSMPTEDETFREKQRQLAAKRSRPKTPAPTGEKGATVATSTKTTAKPKKTAAAKSTTKPKTQSNTRPSRSAPKSVLKRWQRGDIKRIGYVSTELFDKIAARRDEMQKASGGRVTIEQALADLIG